MFLNHEQIKQQGIIEDYSVNEFQDASYNLTIGHIIDMTGKIKIGIESNITDSFTLKPQGMVYVVFKEKIKVPSGIIGFAHVKTTLTKRGILATNVGIIDSKYEGYISTLLINFGHSKCCLSKGDVGLRVTFCTIDTPTEILSKKKGEELDEYIKHTQKDITFLDEKFLNLSSVKKDVVASVFKRLGLFVGVVAILGFMLTTWFQFKDNGQKEIDKAIKNYEKELNNVKEDNKNLDTKLKALELKLSPDSIASKKNP